MTSKTGFVYAMKAQHGGIKIGSTTDVGRRMIDLSRNRDIGLVLIAVAFSTRYEAAERRAQIALAPYRLSGEWFSCRDEAAIAAVMMQDESQ